MNQQSGVHDQRVFLVRKVIIKGKGEAKSPPKHETGGVRIGGVTYTQCCTEQQG